jgi:hypothetical protein
MSQKSDAYASLAKAVLMQWAKDGKPNDFSYTNVHDLEQGTYYDFWETVMWEMQRESMRLSEADSIEHMMGRH